MEAIEKVRNLVGGGLAPGAERSAGPLTVIGLFGGEPAKEYALAQAAFAEGTLKVGEMDGGSVPKLEAFNHGALPVLLLDGEHLKGAMQDRIVNASILLAPQARTVLPVSCVEHGRWHYEGAEEFDVTPEISYARLRRTNATARTDSAIRGLGRQTDQGAVWDDVAQKHDELGVESSATGAMRDAFTVHHDALAEIVSAHAEPQPGQTGAIACVGGKPVALDSFDRPETFSQIWPRLLRGYAMEALGNAPAKLAGGEIDRFLKAAAQASMSESAGVGLGTDVIVTSDKVVGNALTWAEGVVHLALFPTEPVLPPVHEGRIERPSARRLRRL
jgi:hypothetical protein